MNAGKFRSVMSPNLIWGAVVLLALMVGSKFSLRDASVLHAQTRSASGDTPAFVSGSTRNSSYLKQMVDRLRNIEAGLQRIEAELHQNRRDESR